jgi:hypothetical protein
MVRQVIFTDPAKAAAALECWDAGAIMLLRLLKRYEEQEAPVMAGHQIGWHNLRVARNV